MIYQMTQIIGEMMMTNEELNALQQLVVNTDNQRKQITPVNFTQWLKNNLTGNL
jgi:hypothetical protein